ncbi:CocE/NonD family hydrolase [Streptomyces sp. Inha503]|uniref:CocE/NonD family hydrolase n=1 Tax=Streptomyces sp. Inha503 TaxID=3383314 RepID=UPI0039A076E3
MGRRRPVRQPEAPGHVRSRQRWLCSGGPGCPRHPRSPGTFVPHTHEGADGLDTLAWLAEQPGCDGAVAMWGGSYMGFTQWQAPPHSRRHCVRSYP